MNIKERKVIVHFLFRYLKQLTALQYQEINPFFFDLFSRNDVIDILLTLYSNEQLEELEIGRKNNHDLFELIGSDVSILQFYLDKLEYSITASPTLSKTEVVAFFDKCGLHTHYLKDKPAEEWDGYDRSNYYSLLFKHGKTKRVFAIFTADVEEKDKYAVTTKPSFFFDTKEEAEDELEKILQDKDFRRDELKIMSLWQIN